MRLLLDKGADPLIATNEKVTALMVAAGVGWRDGKSHGAESDAIKAIELCLDHGADINAATGKGETALHGATMRGANTVISYLVSRGADVNAKNEKGRAAFTDIVQEFSAQVPATGTSTDGYSPSVPATLACNACSGTFTATSSAPWVLITSVADGAIAFNVFSNISTSPRAATLEAALRATRLFSPSLRPLLPTLFPKGKPRSFINRSSVTSRVTSPIPVNPNVGSLAWPQAS